MVMQIKCVVVVVVVAYIPAMQPRLKEFRQIYPNTLCIPEPIFQQLDSQFSAMLVPASLLLDQVVDVLVAFLLIAILQLWA